MVLPFIQSQKTSIYYLQLGKCWLNVLRKENCKKVYDLNYSHFQQPEGISFDINGDLYISNEAKGGKANILKFNYLL